MRGKKILLGVTGSIAAYKTASLIRLFKKHGAEVQVVMTTSASEFITPLTLSTLSGKPALSDFVKNSEGEWNNHVQLGLWADLVLIAPASANTLAKMANGYCDNLLLSVYLSARCPVMFAPAMDLDMYRHSATADNIKKLTEKGHLLVDAQEGELASGLEGKGRMAEPEDIFSAVSAFFDFSSTLKGKKVLLTAGPTHEPIDPVRFIGNRSTGRMGYELAKVLAMAGAEVKVITGPVNESFDGPFEKIPVETAEEMNAEAVRLFPSVDIAIMAAAVADYAPLHKATEKIKKKSETISLELKKNPDIAENLGKMKTGKQVLAGFALETNNEVVNAQGKLKKKNLDFIILNSLKEKGAGFGYSTNKITILDKDKTITAFELKNKSMVATDVVRYIIEKYA